MFEVDGRSAVDTSVMGVGLASIDSIVAEERSIADTPLSTEVIFGSEARIRDSVGDPGTLVLNVKRPVDGLGVSVA